MLTDLPFELLCHVISFLDTSSTLALSQISNYIIRQAVLLTPRTLTIRSHGEEDCDHKTLQEATFLLKNLQCISCLHVVKGGPEMLEGVCKCLCHRLEQMRLPGVGSISLEVSDDDVACLNRFREMLPVVETMVLQNMRFSEIELFGDMGRLETLVVICPEMDTFMDETFISICKKLPKLKKIVLIGAMYLTDNIWVVLNDLPHLEDFIVRGSAMSGGGVRNILHKGLGGLKKLDLSLSLVDDSFLEEVSLPPTLEFLGLEDTRVTMKKGMGHLQLSPAAKSLKSLGMRGLKLSGDEEPPIPGLPVQWTSPLQLNKFPSLEVWDVVGSGITHSNIDTFFDDPLEVQPLPLPSFCLTPSSCTCGKHVRVLAGDDESQESIVWSNFLQYTQLVG
eukprot:CAMPEP_0201537222 /NCGR_PEP_ID=MMETSP0161_2-20130828/64117_1 /ASSEMBLY_ACC=CAM_ASM_000251 /TAXON_ID=180227 /ORGANISM="Neoparamoeba aestuarina, Strain SoJaBio B1-5/56/2" /LENGTH=391 /DNA_ID=CAMNT_0047943381 /DNA_START=150 /DNA_END=1321 /DNA_ORIENTATION=-